jgi:TPR repeat
MGDCTVMSYSSTAPKIAAATAVDPIVAPSPMVYDRPKVIDPNAIASITAIFNQLALGLTTALPPIDRRSAATSFSVPALPPTLEPDGEYQQALNRYIDRGFQPAILDRQNRLSFSRKLYHLMTEMQSESKQITLAQLQNPRQLEDLGFSCWNWQRTSQIVDVNTHRLLILSAPPRSDQPSSTSKNLQPESLQPELDRALRSSVPAFLDRAFASTDVTTTVSESLSPIEYHADYFPQPLTDADIKHAQGIFDAIPTAIISSQVQQGQVQIDVDFWTGQYPCTPYQNVAHIALPIGVQSESNHSQDWIPAASMAKLYELIIAFVIDWYYLQLNLLYQPKLPQLIQQFPPNWINAALPNIRTLHQRNQAIIFALQGQRSAHLGFWENAIANYEIALELKPNFVEVLLAKGLAQYKMGNYVRAIALLNKVLQYQRDCSEAQYDEAQYYRDLALAQVDSRHLTEKT